MPQMELQKKLAHIEKLKAAIEGFGNFDPQVQKKINYKLRLDWNYYSNRMEGGTLTRGETRSVMVGNIDVKGKPLRDVMEMNQHDKVVLNVLKIGKGEQQLSEKRVRELHKAILTEDDPDKQHMVGEWKPYPNEIINYKGEKFSFAQPEEVPDRIHRLLDNTKAELEKYFKGKSEKHALEIAATFHLEFLTIHPFYDGNGRLARILTNLILISCGYPPFIIKEKKAYYQYLADIQCYGGKEDLLYSFLADRLIDSQQMVLDALEGRNIEEEDDLDKRLALLDQKIQGLGEEHNIEKVLKNSVFFELYDSWFKSLAYEVVPAMQKFNHYFLELGHEIKISPPYTSLSFAEDPIESIHSRLKNSFKEAGSEFSKHKEGNLYVELRYNTFQKGGLAPFSCTYQLHIHFKETHYTVSTTTFNNEKEAGVTAEFTKKLYTQSLTTAEIKQLKKLMTEGIMAEIEYHISKQKQ